MLMASETPPEFDRSKIRLVFPAILAAGGLAALDGNIVSAALPIISSELGGVRQLPWVVTSFMLAQSATLLLYGKLGDIYGRRPLYLTAITAFVLGSAICGFAPNMLVLILSRALQGVGAAGLMSLGSATMADLVPPRERGRYQGMITGNFALSSLAGPVVGGLLTTFFGWRSVFLVNLPLGLIVAILLFRGVPRSDRHERHPIDYAGALLVMTAPAMALLAMTNAGTYGFGSLHVILYIAAALALIAALIWQERRCPYPLLDLTLFHDPLFARCAITITIVAFWFFGAVVFLPLYLQMARGANAASSGAVMVPQLVGLLVASIVGGRLITRTGRFKAFIVAGVTLQTISLVTIGGITLWHAPIPFLLAALFFLGAGGGLAMPTITLAAQSTANRGQIGSATSLMAFAHSVSAASGAAISGTIVSARVNGFLASATDPATARLLARAGTQDLPHLSPASLDIVQRAYEHAIAMAFLTGGAAIVIAMLVAITIPDRTLSRETQ